jgi:hypothetical protein
MSQNNLLNLSLPKIDGDDVRSFCELNQIDSIDNFLYTCFKKGYYIEKYGIIGGTEPVFIEVPVEKVVEKVVEVEKIFHDESKLEEERRIFSTKIQDLEKIFQDTKKNNEELEESIVFLKKEISEKERKIKDLESVVLSPNPEYLRGRYMMGSNINKLI